MGLLNLIPPDNKLGQLLMGLQTPLNDLGVGLTRGKTWQKGLREASEYTEEQAPLRARLELEQKKAETEANTLNKTVQYLRSQPGGAQFADAMESGAIDGGAAYKAWLDASKPAGGGEPFTLGEGQTRYGPNGEVIATGAPKAVDPKDAFNMESDLSKQYLGADPVKTYQGVRNGYEKIRTSAKANSGPGDISMIFAYMKMLDPTSVVREGEFATAANAGGVGEQISGLYNRLLNGERLTPELRKQFLSAATQLYNETAANLSDANQQFSTRAGAWNVDPSRFVMNPETYDSLDLDANDPLGLR